MKRRIYLPLYGRLDHGPQDDLAWDLYQTAPLARLRDISLSSLPSRFMPYGDAVSRFQHAVGVSQLVRELCDANPDFEPWRQPLIAAALCHDCGSPPFSHMAEGIFYEHTGLTHEQAIARQLDQGGELAQVMGAYGVDPQEVAALIAGTHEPLGPLMAGSIDLDNADNSLTLLASFGAPDLPYHPQEFSRLFVLRGGQLMLDAGQADLVARWNETRGALYRVLFKEPNLSAAMMLSRALAIAYDDGALDEEFFALGEGPALDHLQRRCGSQVGALIDEVNRWRHYPRVLHWEMGEAHDQRLYGLSHWRQAKQFADALAEALSVPAHELTIYCGTGRGAKQVKLPFTGPGAEQAAERFSRPYADQQLSVFVHRRHCLDPQQVQRAVSVLVDQLPAGERPEHVFV